jgi:hypothetical protein
VLSGAVIIPTSQIHKPYENGGSSSFSAEISSCAVARQAERQSGCIDPLRDGLGFGRQAAQSVSDLGRQFPSLLDLQNATNLLYAEQGNKGHLNNGQPLCMLITDAQMGQ